MKNDIEEKMNNLIRCPFCGRVGRLNHRYSNGLQHSVIICEGCEAETKTVPISTEYSSDEEVIKLWSARYTKEG